MPKEFICANLDSLLGETNQSALSLAKRALHADFLQHRVEETAAVSLEVQISEDPIAKHYMELARIEASKSTCWADQVGAVVVDQSEEEHKIIATGHNGPVLVGRFCSVLESLPNEIRSLLEPGERLSFCQSIHDVAGIVARAAADGVALRRKNWYLSLEPCDNCANLLVVTKPEAVYFSQGSSRKNYYDSVGLQRLLQAQIPTFYVNND